MSTNDAILMSTHNIPFSAAAIGFSKGFKNEFETAAVNKPSVFEPLKFYHTLCVLMFQTFWFQSNTGRQIYISRLSSFLIPSCCFGWLVGW